MPTRTSALAMVMFTALWGSVTGCQGTFQGRPSGVDPVNDLALSDGGISGGGDGGSGLSPVESLISQPVFEQIFLHRGTAPCPGSFYTYQAFLDAARLYPAFGGQGSPDDRKREVAAFLANISHETTGGWGPLPMVLIPGVCAG